MQFEWADKASKAGLVTAWVWHNENELTWLTPNTYDQAKVGSDIIVKRLLEITKQVFEGVHQSEAYQTYQDQKTAWNHQLDLSKSPPPWNHQLGLWKSPPPWNHQLDLSKSPHLEITNWVFERAHKSQAYQTWCSKWYIPFQAQSNRQKVKTNTYFNEIIQNMCTFSIKICLSKQKADK